MPSARCRAPARSPAARPGTGLPQPGEVRVEPTLEADERHGFQPGELDGSGEVGGRRLLDEDCDPGLGAEARVREMRLCRGREHNDVDTTRGQQVRRGRKGWQSRARRSRRLSSGSATAASRIPRAREAAGM